MKRFIIIFTLIMVTIACNYEGPLSIEDAEFIDSDTVSITIWGGLTSNLYSSDIIIIVNDNDYSYRVTMSSGQSITIGGSKTTDYRCDLNKKVSLGDTMRIQGDGFNVTGEVSVTYE